MYTVYQVHPQQPLLYQYYEYNNSKDALLCARRIKSSFWKVILVAVTKYGLVTHVGEPGRSVRQVLNAGSVLQELSSLRVA